MKKIFSFIVMISVLIIVLNGCGGIKEKKEAVKDTPYQIGQKGQMSASVIGFDFDKSYEKADIIAEIKITEWLGERNNEDELETTIFRASLEKTFKNKADDKLKEIKILQAGNSNYTIKDNPLFKNGDRLLVYLKKAKEVANSYVILGEHTGIFRIIDIDQKEYAVKQLGDCPKLSKAKITVDNSKVKRNLTRSLAQNDSITLFPNITNVFNETYDLGEMEQLIQEQKNK